MKKAVKRFWWLPLLAVVPLLGGGTPNTCAQAPPVVTRTLKCHWARGRITIDGRIEERSWQAAQKVENFVCFWEKRRGRTQTTARLLWDNSYLYFAAEMEDSDLYATVKERNGQTWDNDVFELFFKPVVEKDNRFPLQYYEFQVNALNTHLELFLPSRGAGGYGRFAPLTKLGMESAVRLLGKSTLNDYTDRDEGWVVEGRIPWRAFKAAGGRPQPGTKWKVALCRYDYSVAFERPDLTSTAPLTYPDFHRYEDYNELEFVAPGE